MGSSSVTGDETILFADNMSFDGTARGGKMTIDGQLWIGSTAAPHVRKGTIASSDGSINFTFGSGTINAIVASGPGVGKTITGNSGGALSPTAGNWNILTANSTAKFVGSVSTLTQDFNITNLVLGSSLPALAGATATVGIGSGVLASLTSGVNNTAVGLNAGTATTTGHDNTFIGAAAGQGNIDGYQNVAVGTTALFTNSGTDWGNVAVGYQALHNNITTTNVGVGWGAAAANTTGTNNVAVGYSALVVNLVGGSNTSIGNLTLSSCTGGSNTAIGTNAANNLTSGNSHIAIGVSTNVGVSGDHNIVIGNGAGSNYTGAESNNILFYHGGVNGESNVMRLGVQGSGTAQINQTYLAGVLNMLSGLVVKVTTPGAYPYTTLITDYLVLVDTASARTIVPLAAPVTGTTFVIKDNVGSAAANNITVTPSGKNIDGAASYTINSNYGSITIIYNGTQWNIL